MTEENNKERDDFLESRETEILAFHSKVRTNNVLREVWDEAQRQAAPTWQPIDTAPKDGTWILLAGDSGYTTTPSRVAVCRYMYSPYRSWRDHAGDDFLDGGSEPTHWMPHTPVPLTQKPLSKRLLEVVINSGLDAESIDIITDAAEQLEKQEQADD